MAWMPSERASGVLAVTLSPRVQDGKYPGEMGRAPAASATPVAEEPWENAATHSW